MAKKLPSLSKLKEFIKDWNARKGLDTVQLAYGLFEKLYTGEYQNQSFSNTASQFIEKFGNQIDDEFKNKCLSVCRRDCDNFVEKSLKKNKEKIAEEGAGNEEEINDYLSQCEKYIQGELEKLRGEWLKGKGKTLLYVFQLMAISKKILITDHYFHNVESRRGIYCLFAPSHIHYLFQRHKTVFICVWLLDGEGLKSRLCLNAPPNMTIYGFTLNAEIVLFRIAELNHYNDKGVKLVTTNSLKSKRGLRNSEVITLEEFFKLLECQNNFGKNQQFTDGKKKGLQEFFEYQKFNFRDYKIFKDFYQEKLNNLQGINNSVEYKSIEEIIDKG